MGYITNNNQLESGSDKERLNEHKRRTITLNANVLCRRLHFWPLGSQYSAIISITSKVKCVGPEV